MGVCETVYSDRAELMTQWAVGVNPQDPLPPSFKCRGFDSQLPNVFLRVSEGDCQAQLLQHSLLKWVLVPPLIGICQKLAPKHFFPFHSFWELLRVLSFYATSVTCRSSLSMKGAHVRTLHLLSGIG